MPLRKELTIKEWCRYEGISHFSHFLRDAIRFWMGLVSCSDAQPPAHLMIETDWFREAAMSAVELDLPLTVENAWHLLEDHTYFETHLAIAAPEWGQDSGTECMRQWWLELSPEFRATHLFWFKRMFVNQPKIMSVFSWNWWEHTSSGDPQE